jgi:hypothetical protein
VQYCIPLWLRDEQVRSAIARPVRRLEFDGVKRATPVAVVCYGPSLADTWEQVRDAPAIITCSGAHKFLLERGIVPTWHVEVDPRPHKVDLLGPPHPDVTYLVASACAPEYFDHLADFDVRLWHVFSHEADAGRMVDHGGRLGRAAGAHDRADAGVYRAGRVWHGRMLGRDRDPRCRAPQAGPAHAPLHDPWRDV